MDYTTLDRVKNEMLKLEVDIPTDTLLGNLVKAVSRAIDRHCTGALPPGSDNYFEHTTVSSETVRGNLNNEGHMIFVGHKPSVTAFTALNWKLNFTDSWQAVSASMLFADGSMIMTAYTGLQLPPCKVFGQLTYTGGLATKTTDLPSDFMEAATAWTVRFFRENQTGLTDQIGVADIGVLLFTKAMPDRIRQMLQPYVRPVPWRVL